MLPKLPPTPKSCNPAAPKGAGDVFHLHTLPHGARVSLHREADNPPRDGHWLLAAAKPFIQNGDTLCDVGCGSGIISLCAAQLFPKSTVYALDNDPSRIEALKANIALNSLTNITPFLSEATTFTLPEKAQHILTNPPFYAETAGHQSQTDLRQRARNLPEGLLQSWMDACLKDLATGGILHTIVHTREETTLQNWAHENNLNSHTQTIPETGKRVIVRITADGAS